jgi:hypothetical protein
MPPLEHVESDSEASDDVSATPVPHYDLRERKVKEPAHPDAQRYRLPEHLLPVPGGTSGVSNSGSTHTSVQPGNVLIEKDTKVNVSQATLFDDDDLTLCALMLYKRTFVSSKLNVVEAKLAKVVGSDPATKPISVPPPRNRKEALSSPWWAGYHAAECAEMASHDKNGTWVLKPRSEVPAGVPILRDRWAYDDKLAPGGKHIERFKARLTAMGCFQKEGIDYTDTYASVMSTRTFRMLLQIYNSLETNSLEHWDVSTAFIHAPLKEQVYMKQASGHEVKGKESWVCLLKKALYGTKQAARAWQLHLRGLLAEAKLVPMVADPAVYFWRQGDAFVLIGTHVDDLFVCYNRAGTKQKEKVWGHLSSKLAIKNLGEARWTLQMAIQRDAVAGILKLSQENFVLEVLRRFQMENCHPVPTPAVDSGKEATMTEEDCPQRKNKRMKLKTCHSKN